MGSLTTFTIVLAAVLLFSLIATVDRRPVARAPPELRPTAATDLIFVALVVMPGEEAECARCLRTIFSNAWAPERIQVAVMHYFDPGTRIPGGVGIDAYYSSVRAQYDRICLETPGSRNCGDCLRVLERPAHLAKGVSAAHAELLRRVYGGEPFWCEAFPKLRFVSQWDRLAVEELRRCCAIHGPNSLLTVAPADRFSGATPSFPVVVRGTGDHGFPQVKPRLFRTKRPGRPFAAPLLAPSFVFAPGKMVADVPPDPRLQFCDGADALLRTARLFTHGWRPFAPSRVLVHRHRINPVDADDGGQVITKATTKTADSRQRREKSFAAALSVLGEDACAVCDRPRSQHTSASALNHPFEAPLGALANRSRLLGSAATLTQFKEYCGAWPGKLPTVRARCGVVGTPAGDERAAKGLEHGDFLLE